MKKFLQFLLLIIITLVLFSCATTKATKPFNEQAIQLSEESLVYIYRMNSVSGIFSSLKVLMDRKNIGYIKMGAFLNRQISEGEHQFVLSSTYKREDSIKLLAGRGKKYFIRIVGKEMEIVDENIALSELKNMKDEN